MAVACAAASAACQGTPPAEPGLRVLVRLAGDSAAGATADMPPAAIEQRASASAGVSAKYVAPSGARWHALILQCAASDCDAALQRLSADTARFSAVQRDERRRH
ncbi:MAG: hypothetical protein B7Y51_02125 [Burkholderiales bacterium 28-67-8]|nr:MAG: hypothetical protein B7Y51_02125 [Burkholderiales bacterium 28-67-8]